MPVLFVAVSGVVLAGTGQGFTPHILTVNTGEVQPLDRTIRCSILSVSMYRGIMDMVDLVVVVKAF